MPVPDFQSLMLPFLQMTSDGRDRSMLDAREHLAAEFHLTQVELDDLLPSGRQTRFVNRVAWAKVHLEQAGLLKSVRRGWFRITERGMEVLQHPPERLTLGFLRQFPEFEAFRGRRRAWAASA